MLACFSLAAHFLFAASTLTLLSTVVLALMPAMGVWLSLHKDFEIFASLGNGMNEAVVSVWPFTLEILLLVILRK